MCGRLAYDQPEMVTGAGTLALALEIDAQAADAGCPDRMLHSARINGHDPYAYFKDVLERLPTHPANRIDELLPHRWSTAS